MNKLLYYSRVFWKTASPMASDPEILVEEDVINLFMADVIEYSFRSQGLGNFFDPNKLNECKETYLSCPSKRYFNGDIGWAVSHFCAEKSSSTMVQFNLKTWFEMKVDEFVEYPIPFLEDIIDNTRPVHLGLIYSLAFTGWLAKEAVKMDKKLVTKCISRVAVLLQQCFPFEWIYHDLQQWAQTYKARHIELRNCEIENVLVGF